MWPDDLAGFPEAAHGRPICSRIATPERRETQGGPGVAQPTQSTTETPSPTTTTERTHQASPAYGRTEARSATVLSMPNASPGIHPKIRRGRAVRRSFPIIVARPVARQYCARQPRNCVQIRRMRSGELQFGTRPVDSSTNVPFRPVSVPLMHRSAICRF